MGSQEAPGAVMIRFVSLGTGVFIFIAPSTSESEGPDWGEHNLPWVPAVTKKMKIPARGGRTCLFRLHVLLVKEPVTVEHIGVVVRPGITMHDETRRVDFGSAWQNSPVGELELLASIALQGHCALC